MGVEKKIQNLSGTYSGYEIDRTSRGGEMMLKYPKPIMRKTELQGMGFPEECLMAAYHSRGQDFAHKINPTKKNSPIIFDTAGFERWRQNQIRMEVGG